MEKLADSGDHRLLTRVRELLEKFRNAILEAFARLAGEDSATAAAMRTETEDALRLIDTFIEQAKQTEEIRAERLAEQSEVLRKDAERGELESRAESAETSSYKSLKGATAEEISTLADAKQLLENGADSEEVRRRTGWFKGYDGQWRIEIDDSRMKLTLPDVLFSKDFARYTELNNRFEKGQSKRGEVSEMLNLATELRDQLPKKLDDIIDHSALFEVCPELKNVRVEFAALGDLIDATFEDEINRIEINTSLLQDQEEMRAALIHEIQHAVQDIEGLTGGSDITTAGYDRYIRTAGEIEAYDVQNRVNLTAEERRNTRPDIDRTDMMFADGGVSYSINPEFAEDIDIWDKDGRDEAATFTLGTTGDVLQGLGAVENDIYLKGDKIVDIFNNHPEMTIEEIKRLPEIIDDPVLILASRGKDAKRHQNTRLVIFGTVKAQNGQPIMSILDLRPTENGLVVEDMQKLTSAYTKEKPKGFIEGSDFLYVDKKRTLPLLRTMGLQYRPTELQQTGSIGSITYDKQNVNISGKRFSEVIHASGSHWDTETSSLKVTDEDYMAAVERGDRETAQEMVDEAAEALFPDSKVRGNDGKLLKVYHGTDADFWSFDFGKHGGQHGMAEGFGIYLTDRQEVSGSYRDRQIAGYVNIKRSAYGDQKTVKRMELAKLIEASMKREARQMMEEDEYDNINDAMYDTWISNYVYTYEYNSINAAIMAVAGQFLSQNDNDADIVYEVMNGIGIRDSEDASAFYDEILTPTTGIDGLWQKWNKGDAEKEANIILAFRSNQIKSADPVTYDDAGNVIPLSERFNEEKEDIRWSKKATDVRAELAERTVGRDELGQMLDETAQFLRQARQTVDKAEYDLWIQNLRTGGRLPQRGQLLKVVRQYNEPNLTGISNEALADRIFAQLAVMTDNRTIPVLYQSINRPDNPNRSVGRIHKNKYRQHPIWC